MALRMPLLEPTTPLLPTLHLQGTPLMETTLIHPQETTPISHQEVLWPLPLPHRTTHRPSIIPRPPKKCPVWNREKDSSWKKRSVLTYYLVFKNNLSEYGCRIWLLLLDVELEHS